MTRALPLVLALALLPAPVKAATILFVSNSGGDGNIARVLTAEGHAVTSAPMGFAALAGDLSTYDVIFWSANGSYSVPSTTFTALTAWVMAGGRVFVTGYDSIISNTELARFCGGSGALDLTFSSAPGPIARVENSLTVGVVDIQGVTPTGGYDDRDGLTGLGSDTVEVAASSGGGSSQWSLRTLGAGEVAWVSNGTYSGDHASWEVTTAGGAGAYNAAIRNFAAAAEPGVTEPGAPDIEFTGDFSAEEGAAYELTVSVTDPEGDSASWSWDIDDDGTFGEMPDMTTFRIAEGTTDGPSTIRVGVRATDGMHVSERRRNIRISNVAPHISGSPPPMTSVGENLRYPLAVTDPAGALDPLAYAVVHGPTAMTISPEGVVMWTPNERDVTGLGEVVVVEVQVDDGDEGQDTQRWEMTVSPNRAPSNLTLIYPKDGVGLLDTLPRLVVSDGTDPDHDTLEYFFQIDSVDTFDSAALQESGPVTETPGFSFWYVPEPLAPGRWFWRAWLTDGAVVTDPVLTSFFVVPDPTMIPDAGPEPDGGPTPDAGPPPRMRDSGGCGCSTPKLPVSAMPLLPATVLAVLLLLRRRRR